MNRRLRNQTPSHILWNDPDLGLAYSIQLLDEPGVAENGGVQR
ncbi:MAG: hypothetical protein ABI651_08515 [Verrucomicrobiota bacterium]